MSAVYSNCHFQFNFVGLDNTHIPLAVLVNFLIESKRIESKRNRMEWVCVDAFHNENSVSGSGNGILGNSHCYRMKYLCCCLALIINRFRIETKDAFPTYTYKHTHTHTYWYWTGACSCRFVFISSDVFKPNWKYSILACTEMHTPTFLTWKLPNVLCKVMLTEKFHLHLIFVQLKSNLVIIYFNLNDNFSFKFNSTFWIEKHTAPLGINFSFVHQRFYFHYTIISIYLSEIDGLKVKRDL